MIKRGRDPPATLKHLYESLHTFFLRDTREDNDKTSSSRALTRNPRISEQHPHAHLLGFDQHHRDTRTLMLTAQACWVRICTSAKKRKLRVTYVQQDQVWSLEAVWRSCLSPISATETWFKNLVSDSRNLGFSPSASPTACSCSGQAFPRWEHTRVISPKWTPRPQPLLFHLSHPDRLRKEVKT